MCSMVASGPDLSCLFLHRMHRNVMRPSPNLAVMAAKPPKPPCWRDFVTASKFQSHSLNESEFTDISKIAKSSNESFSSDGQVNNKQGKPKRLRAKIHRTRSQFTIEESDLPEETLTVTLAETNPDDIGLCRPSAFDERIFQEDNNRKCQTWLQNIEACKPLEDVTLTSEQNEPEEDGVSIEIPDDTHWYGHVDVHSSHKTCVNDSDKRCRVETVLGKALHRTRTYTPSQEQVSNSKGHRCHEGKHSAVYKGDKHINTG